MTDSGLGFLMEVGWRAGRLPGPPRVYSAGPVLSGIVGWYEARRVQLADGDRVLVIPDLGPLHEDLVPALSLDKYQGFGLTTQLYLKYAAGRNPSLVGEAPNFAFGTQTTAYSTPREWTGRLDGWAVGYLASFPFWHNSNCCSSFGQRMADNYSGPLIGSITGGRPSYSFGNPPISKHVVAFGPSPLPGEMTAVLITGQVNGTIEMYHNGELQDSVPWLYGLGWNDLELGRGNNFFTWKASIFYNRHLNQQEGIQTCDYLKFIGGL